MSEPEKRAATFGRLKVILLVNDTEVASSDSVVFWSKCLWSMLRETGEHHIDALENAKREIDGIAIVIKEHQKLLERIAEERNASTLEQPPVKKKLQRSKKREREV